MVLLFGCLRAVADEHYINTVVYDVLRGSSYTPLPKELQHSSKGLVNLKNEDNECFRWFHVRYLNPQEKNPQRIKKMGQENGRAVEL